MADHFITAFRMDSPVVLDASVTNIPGSGSLPLQIVATSGPYEIKNIEYLDGVGQLIGMYLGAAGSETFLCCLGGGGKQNRIVRIPEGSRVSLRSEQAAAITKGVFYLEFQIYNGKF